MSKIFNNVFACMLILSIIIVGCGNDNDAQGYTIVKPGTLKPGDKVPPPTGPVVLSITGNISATNLGDRLDLDMETLEALDLISYTTYDAGIRRKAAYQGVLLKDLLELAGASKDATLLKTSALNDYETDIPLTAMQWPVMLATVRDGHRMTIEDKGPIEVVFPYDSFNIDATYWDPKWVWMLRNIEVR